MQIINWLNLNQGFAMCLLTLVYVVATLAIMLANRKTATLAAQANRQQAALALFERRMLAYDALKQWVFNARILFSADLAAEERQELFGAFMYNNSRDRELEELNDQLKAIDRELDQPDVEHEERQLLESRQQQLEEHIFLKRMSLLDEEHKHIQQIEFLFPEIDFGCVGKFCASFLSFTVEKGYGQPMPYVLRHSNGTVEQVAEDNSARHLQQLELCLKSLNDGFLQQLWQEISEVGVV